MIVMNHNPCVESLLNIEYKHLRDCSSSIAVPFWDRYIFAAGYHRIFLDCPQVTNAIGKILPHFLWKLLKAFFHTNQSES